MSDKKVTTLIIDKELLRDLKVYCSKNSITMSRLISDLVRIKIKEKNGIRKIKIF